MKKKGREDRLDFFAGKKKEEPEEEGEREGGERVKTKVEGGGRDRSRLG